MNQCNVIAIDLAKDIFQVCTMNSRGKIGINQAFSRAKLKRWLPQQPLSVIAMERLTNGLHPANPRCSHHGDVIS
jgi:transposase